MRPTYRITGARAHDVPVLPVTQLAAGRGQELADVVEAEARRGLDPDQRVVMRWRRPR